MSINSNFTVSATGFRDQYGQPWSMRGLDMDVKDALPAIQGSLLKDYPGLTAIRLVCNAGVDTAQSLASIVQAYTSKGIVVEIEDHWDTQNADNSGWYASMATAYKSNPYVFLETPNEPDPTGLAAKQIDIINAIRGAGFTNPIGVQPGGGWDTSNIPAVLAQFGTNDGLYETPHIYYNGTDPNGAQQYVASTVSEASSRGIFAAIDEFGNAIDGFTLDPEGNTVITAVTAANEAGQAGAIFWAADNGNHADGADSAFLTPDGSQLTSTGKMLQPWLSQPGTPVPPTPTPVPTPADVTTGTGSDTLVLSVSEDAYANGDGTSNANGDATFTVSIDGKQQGGTFTASAAHGGVDQTFAFNGDWAPGAHTVTVNFLNDAYGGATTTDRNLYVDAVKYDGTDIGQSATFLSGGAQSLTITDSTAIPVPAPAGVMTGAGSDTLVLDISEDAYANGDGTSDANGDAAFTVSIDGKQMGGTFAAAASHTAGVTQSFAFKGDWAPGAHTVSMNFLNDAYGGTATTDRNLYVDAVKYDGTDTNQTGTFLGAGAQSFAVTDSTALPVTPTPTPTGIVTGTGSDALVLSISEDAYANGDGTSDANGDSTFTVSVDGKQIGSTFTTTASHAAGVDQKFTFNGDWAPGAHTVTVNFLNDAYGGSTHTDRNLYVDAVSYDGKDTNQSTALLSTGPQSLTVTDATAIPAPPQTVIPYITPGIGQFSDAAGNVYVLDKAGTAIENGSAMPDGGGTSAMEYAHGTVYAQDAGGSGWYTPSNGSFVATAAPPSAAIAIPAGTSTENVSDTAITASSGDHMLFIGGSGDTVRLTGGTETVQALQGGNSITTGSGADKLTVGGSGNIITAGSGANQITDQGSGNTLMLPGAGGADNIFGPILTNGDVLDLRGALATTTWNGANSTLAKYLSVSTVNNSAVLTLHPAGGHAGSMIATLENSGPASLTTILAHAIT